MRRISNSLSGIFVFFLAVCVALAVCYAAQGNEVSPDEPVRAYTPGGVAQPSLVEDPSETFQETIQHDDKAQQNAPDAVFAEPFTVETSPEVVPVSASGARAETVGEQETKYAPTQPDPQMPQWVLQRETLSFRVDFLGISVGYARFQCLGVVSVEGRVAYHIKVRAWTSGALSFIYPIDETIDYYLDAETIQPIRIEYVGRKNRRDDVAIYDQKNGKIVYFYLDDGTIRKTVDTVSSCYDPVSAVFYFRSRDINKEDKPVNLYAGRKIYQIAGRSAGNARLKTRSGPAETLVIEPVIWREGKPYDKGEFRMWVTNDDRRVPVRIFGKFRKIKDWTLIGELLPEQQQEG